MFNASQYHEHLNEDTKQNICTQVLGFTISWKAESKCNGLFGIKQTSNEHVTWQANILTTRRPLWRCGQIVFYIVRFKTLRLISLFCTT